MTYDLHVDAKNGHITVDTGDDEHIYVMDMGGYCHLANARYMTPSQAFAVGAALQQWSINKRRNKGTS